MFGAQMAVVVPTRIDRVTLYRNGALVVRRGALPDDLDDGGQLEVRGLPLLYGHDTLRLRVEGSALRLGAIEEAPDLGISAKHEVDAARTRELKAEIRLLQAEKRALAGLAKLLNDALVPGTIELPEEGEIQFALHDLLADQTRVAELRERIAADQAELAQRLKTAKTTLAELRRRTRADHTEGEGTAARVTRALRCSYEGDGGGTLEIEYFVRGARWVPVYELHVSDETARLQLAAQVAQATGESWEGVAVSLSTADLRRGTRLPKLAEWRIGRATSKAPAAWRALPEDLDSLFEDFDRVAPVAAAEPPMPKRRAKAAAAAEDEHSFDLDEPDSWTGGAEAEAEEERPAEMQSMAISEPVPRPQAIRASASLSSGVRKSAPMPGKAMAGNVAPPATTSVRRPEGRTEPGRLLDYAWLQLPDWSDRLRGRLVHVDLTSRLKAFVEERGGEPADHESVHDALRALREQRRRVEAGALPSGCSRLQDASFHHRYLAGPRVDVAADGRWHRVVVQEAEGKYHEIYRVVPRQSDRVFRFAVLKNPLEQPLASGPLEVYVDDQWQVRGQLEAIGAGGTLRLNLGIEEGLRVARHVVFGEEEQGMIAAETVLTHRVRTEVRSVMRRKVRLQVFEQLPEVIDEEDVVVALTETTPEPVRDRGLDGLEQEGALRWDIDLEAGALGEVNWTYTVTLPAKRELVGGNRREP